ncbi:hypothetical protein LTS18_013324, partial [Coniosporium uncinatum]
MAAMNLVLLLPRPLSALASFFRMPLDRQIFLHCAIASILVAQIVLHGAVSATTVGLSANMREISGILSASCLIGTSALSLSPIRNKLYELFMTQHCLLSLAACAALWLHAQDGSLLSRICVSMSVGVWSLSHLLHCVQRIRRNFFLLRALSGKSIWATTVRWRNEDSNITTDQAILVDALPARPWRYRAGQYVYLVIPSVRAWKASVLERHPFLIASWDGEELSLIIQPREGFTKHMSTVAERGRQELALIDGPYGVTHDMSGFGTVIMIATGSGVIAFLSYIHKLLREFEGENAVTRRIELIWKCDRD